MAKKDLYKTLKKQNGTISAKDFKESIFDLVDQALKKGGLTDKQKQKVYRLRAYIDVNYKDF